MALTRATELAQVHYMDLKAKSYMKVNGTTMPIADTASSTAKREHFCTKAIGKGALTMVGANSMMKMVT